MPRFAANLSLLYPELEFTDRFGAAARDGFRGVEFLFPYAHEAGHLAALLKHHGLQQVLFNAPPGDWEAGERGTACLPGREAEFREGIAQAIAYARVLGCPRIHVMAGIAPADAEPAALRATYVANLRDAAVLAAPHGIALLIEPINGRDMPGYFLQRQEDAHALALEIAEGAGPVDGDGQVRVQVQMDLYHCQIAEGDVATKLRRYLPTGRVGHLQIAGVPERHEPDRGELHYPYLFRLIDALGYAGWIGCEYRPARGAVAGGTSAGLDWLAPWARAAAGDGAAG